MERKLIPKREPETAKEKAYLRAHPAAVLGKTDNAIWNFDNGCLKCKAALEEMSVPE